jgi:hypothetical protein
MDSIVVRGILYKRNKDYAIYQSNKKLWFIHKNNNIQNEEIGFQTKDYHKWLKKQLFYYKKKVCGYTSAIVSKHGKRDSNEGIAIQIV